MDRTQYQRQAEKLVEWGASALLAAATGWAAAILAQSMWVGIAVLAGVLPTGVRMLKWVGGQADTALELPEFAPESIKSAADDELLLDDPIAAVAPDSRVVSLFDTRLATGEETPGAMVSRIADYLGDRAPQPPPTIGDGEQPGDDDAGAALHRALANIRASLR